MRRLIIQANHQSGEQGSTGDQLKERIHPRHTTDKGTLKEEEEEEEEGRKEAGLGGGRDRLLEGGDPQWQSPAPLGGRTPQSRGNQVVWRCVLSRVSHSKRSATRPAPHATPGQSMCDSNTPEPESTHASLSNSMPWKAKQSAQDQNTFMHTSAHVHAATEECRLLNQS